MNKKLLVAFFLLIALFANAQKTATVSGYVRDADGNPLDLVAVQAENTLIGTMTNEKGYYSLPIATGDSVSILYSCLGFNKAQRIIPKLEADQRLNVQMNYAFYQIGEVTVKAIKKQTTTLETLDASNIKLLPDPSGGSIESLIVTYAGVSSNNELSSQYSVRGGSFDENIVYVNGLEIFRPLLIRSGQQEGLSFINPDLTKEVNFAAGGFEAKYGDKMSSVLDITYKQPTKLEGSASASLLGANAYVGNSIGKFSQITGIRYKTTQSMLNSLETEAEYDPNFVDLQTYMTYAFTPKTEVNLLGNVSSNTYNFTPFSRETSFGTTDNINNFKVFFDGHEKDKFQTIYGALTVKHRPTSKTELGLQAAAFNSTEQETYDIAGEYWINQDSESPSSILSVGKYHEHARNKLTSNVVTIGHYGTTSINTHNIKWGANLQMENIYDRISEWEMRDSAGYSLPQTGETVNVVSNLYSDNSLESIRTSAYLQDTYKFRTKQGMFTIVGGLRASYWSYNKETIISPRISAGFIPNNNQDLTFRLATGIYYQAPFYKELRTEQTDEFGNNIIHLNQNIKSQQSIHLIAGSDYTFKHADRNFKLTTELYYKKLNNLNPYTIDNVKIRYYGENCAQGYAYGLDVKLFGEFVPGTDSWISFSLMQAEQTINQTTKAPLPNEQQYNVSLFFQDYFPGYERIKLSLKGALSGGIPVTAPGTGYEEGFYRTPPYKRVDLGFSYQLLAEDGSLRQKPVFSALKNIWIGLDVFNIFDMNNVNSYYWITDVNSNKYAVPNYLTGRQINARLIVDF